MKTKKHMSKRIQNKLGHGRGIDGENNSENVAFSHEDNPLEHNEC